VSIERNSYTRLLDLINATTAPSQEFVCIERVLAITVVALLLLATCAFAKVGVFATFEYSHLIGFSCIGIATFIVFMKGILLSLQYCKSQITVRADHSFTCKPVTITEEDRKNAIPL